MVIETDRDGRIMMEEWSGTMLLDGETEITEAV